MTLIQFFCPYCSHLHSCSLDTAGTEVVCLACEHTVHVPLLTPASPETPTAVLKSNQTDTPIPDANQRPKSHRPSQTRKAGQETTESIFSDSNESDDSLFGSSATVRKPILPPSPPQKASGVLPFPRRAETPEVPTAQAAIPIPIEVNPFELPVEEARVEAPKRAKRTTPKQDKKATRFQIDWKLILLAGVSVYAAFVTILAIWGWLRSPKAHPEPTPHTQNAPAQPKK